MNVISYVRTFADQVNDLSLNKMHSSQFVIKEFHVDLKDLLCHITTLLGVELKQTGKDIRHKVNLTLNTWQSCEVLALKILVLLGSV